MPPTFIVTIRNLYGDYHIFSEEGNSLYWQNAHVRLHSAILHNFTISSSAANGFDIYTMHSKIYLLRPDGDS